jgi:hypothetical protein
MPKESVMHASLIFRLEAAVTTLSGNGALKDRLTRAYARHLEQLETEALPPTVRSEFAALANALHSARALPGDNVVRASVRKLSNEEAERCAALIVRTYTQVAVGDLASAPPSLKIASSG